MCFKLHNVLLLLVVQTIQVNVKIYTYCISTPFPMVEKTSWLVVEGVTWSSLYSVMNIPVTCSLKKNVIFVGF